MNTRDRWFYAVSLLVSVLPFSIMAMALRFLPDDLPIMDILGKEIELMSKNRNLIIGVFCLVPLTAVLTAGYLKSRRVIERNFYSVTVGAMVVSVSFLCFVVYQLILQAKRSEIPKGFDYVGFISVCLAYVVALLGAPLYSIRPNDSLGLRNSLTCRSAEVWTSVHHHCSYVVIIGFTLTGTAVSFTRGLISLAVLVGAVFLFLLYAYLASIHYYKREKASSQSKA